MISFYLLSDFHSEMRNDPKSDLNKILKNIEKNDDNINICLIAGDFDSPFKPNFKQLLSIVKSHFNYVFYVPGNHEYYHTKEKKSIEETDDYIKKLCIDTNVIFLQCDEYNIKIEDIEINILGCTLWSNISKVGYELISDSRFIFSDINQYLNLHQKHLSWLEDKINNNSDKKYIIVTHHLPSFKLIHSKFNPDDKDNINTAFASDLDHLVSKSLLWVCGHSHERMKIDNMRLNPIGYPREKRQTTYSYHPIFIINTKNE